MASSIPFYERYPSKDYFLHQGMSLSGFFCKKDRMEKIPDFEVREDDICLVTFPRTGTRWTAEILSWIKNDADEEKIKAASNMERCPYLEMDEPNIVDQPDLIPVGTRRLYCTHLGFDLAPKQLAVKGKIVCVLRNPKDSAVSYYHFYRMNKMYGPYEGTWEEFYEGFSRGEIEYGSYFDFVNSWWERRSQGNIIFIRYEEMKRDPAAQIRKMAEFVGKSISEETVQLIMEKTTFKSMKNDPNINISRRTKRQIMRQDIDTEFIRKGEVGDWKNYFTVAQNEEFDKLIQEKFKGTGLIFEY